MGKSKKEQFNEILSKAKEYKKDSFSTGKSFDFEVIDVNSEIENSILFNSINEAVETMSEFIGNHKKDELTNKILKLIPTEDLVSNPSFRLNILLS